jgi:2-polyprenyl-3-methyl-5-hydroxy-6-metoxy-1,4-benzoquinol methylase
MENTYNIIHTHTVEFCPLCGQAGYLLFENQKDRLFGASGKWNTMQCQSDSCKLLWLNPMPNKEDIGKAYANYYTHLTGRTNILPFLYPIENGYLSVRYGYSLETNRMKRLLSYLIYLFPTERAEIDFSILHLSNNERGKLLDIGCGSGTFISKMANLGWDAHGIDFDAKAIEVCVQNGLNAQTGDLFSQQYPDNYYDTIVLNHVIEHLYDTLDVIKECFRVLKPNGKLIIATPNTNSWMFRFKFKQNWFSLQPPGHLQLFNLKNLSNILHKQGFEIERGKTSIRNEFYVYAASKTIIKKGGFKMGYEKTGKRNILVGKVYQMITWFLLPFNKHAGGELYIKAIKK